MAIAASLLGGCGGAGGEPVAATTPTRPTAAIDPTGATAPTDPAAAIETTGEPDPTVSTAPTPPPEPARDAGPRARSVVTVGKAEVTGTVRRSVILDDFRAMAPVLAVCHERALDADPALAGTVTITFTVDADGWYRDVQVTGLTPDVNACLLDEIRVWTYRGGRGERGTVRQTVTFAVE